MNRFVGMIPGFGSRVRWRQGAAGIYYGLCLLSLLGGRWNVSLAFLGLPFVVCAIIGLVTQREQRRRHGLILGISATLLLLCVAAPSNGTLGDTLPRGAVVAQRNNGGSVSMSPSQGKDAVDTYRERDGDTVFWVPNGKSYHSTSNCRTLARSKTIKSGSLQQSETAGKTDPCNICVR